MSFYIDQNFELHSYHLWFGISDTCVSDTYIYNALFIGRTMLVGMPTRSSCASWHVN